MEGDADRDSGFSRETGVFHSKEPAVHLPAPDINAITYVFSRLPQSANTGTGTAFLDAVSGRALDYAALRRSVRGIAAGLHRMGVRRGDVVMLVSPNSVMLPCVLMAVLSLGAVATAANPLNAEREILAQIRDSEPRLIFTVAAFAGKFRAAGVPIVSLDGGAGPNSNSDPQFVCTLTQLMQSQSDGDGDGDGEPVAVRRDEAAVILYSSGTTGKSKGVVLTHGNVAAMIATMAARQAQPGHNPVMLTVPLFHVYGFVLCLICVAVQSTVVMSAKFELQQVLEAIGRFQVAELLAIPPIIVALTKVSTAGYDLSSLKFVTSAGAPLSWEVSLRFCSRFPGVRILQGYGLTESCGPIVAYSVQEHEQQPGDAIGVLGPNTQAKILDIESGKPLPPNHQGELCIRGPTIMKGYYRNPEATNAAIDDQGWFKTGDLCYFDHNGFFFVVDRTKDLIKYKTFQVAPAELEEILVSHPQVLDAAVIPYPDEEAGQIPMACVVAKAGSNLSEKAVMSFVAEQVSPYKKIRKVAFVDSVPRSVAGKILKKDLLHHPALHSRL